MNRRRPDLFTALCAGALVVTFLLMGCVLLIIVLRGAAALVIAALQAPGESLVLGLGHLRRGYDRLEEKLLALGANVAVKPVES